MNDKARIKLWAERCERLKNILYDMHDVDSDMIVSYIRRDMLTPNDARFLLNVSEVDENDDPDLLEFDMLFQKRKEIAYHMRSCISKGMPIPTIFVHEWGDICKRLGEYEVKIYT